MRIIRANYLLTKVITTYQGYRIMDRKAITRFIKFGIVGGSGVVVNQGVFMLLAMSPMPLFLRSALAITSAIFTNFILNYHWTWADRKSNTREMAKSLLKFFFSSLSTALLFNTLPLMFMVKVLSWNDNISNIIGIAVAAGINFLISHFWTFKSTKPNND